MHDNKQFAGSMAATWRRACSLGAVTVGVALLLGACAMKPQPSPEELQARQAHLDKVQKAKARFEELCKTAGITVNRRVTGVKGIRLEKVPPKSNWKDWADPMWAEAALSDGLGGDVFIRRLLLRRVRDSSTGELDGGVSSRASDGDAGFDFVDAKAEGGKWRRYSIVVLNDGYMDMVSKPVSEYDLAPYSVSYNSIENVEDRRLWIAGVDIVVSDSRARQQLGVIRRYIIDTGQGDQAGGRSPWRFSEGNNSCPRMVLSDLGGFFWMSLNNIIKVEE
ncbi:hypothetical protein H5407_10840 [Mitsuaria sp. WAJ17]|uniref:hypothetical protein n=1 Tax=Mitsuaria sp. WAJ17 TaxID=2761452 RepID=UPI0016025CE5|nr:hypothetical protein [Mitsuaria sp. WAJ17]MBB2485715.1 hypothetical protein [Mitsuaria sp. WAJ17]